MTRTALRESNSLDDSKTADRSGLVDECVTRPFHKPNVSSMIRRTCNASMVDIIELPVLPGRCKHVHDEVSLRRERSNQALQ